MSAFYNVDQPPFNSRSTARAIAAANNGLLFDIGDMSTMFQDAAGTTPVTAVEQPVGKILDKSGNGNHATQSVTASRPVLSARYNLLTKTEDLSDAVWIKTYCTITTNSITDPFGGNSADTITSTSSSTSTFIYQVVAPLASGAIYTASRYVKAGSITKCTLGLHQLADIYFDLNTLTYNIIGAGAISASIIDVGDGWRKITGSWQWGSGTVYQVYFAAASTMSSQIGVPVGGTLYSFGHSLVLGTTSGPYQRVTTSTDYDTNPALFPKYLKFDGIDDYLSLPWMNLAGSALGATTIVAMDSRANGSGVTYVLSEKTTYSPVTVYGPMYLAYGLAHRVFMMKDDTALLDVGYSVSPSVANIFSVVDDLINITQRKNGIIENQVSFTHPELVTNHTLIGASNHGGTIYDFFTGNIYGLILTKSALTDAQRVRCERFLARKAGVML